MTEKTSDKIVWMIPRESFGSQRFFAFEIHKNASANKKDAFDQFYGPAQKSFRKREGMAWKCEVTWDNSFDAHIKLHRFSRATRRIL